MIGAPRSSSYRRSPGPIPRRLSTFEQRQCPTDLGNVVPRHNGPLHSPGRRENTQQRDFVSRPAARASLALDNLRALVILLVLSFHSVLAYLNFLPASPFAFDAPPYLWRPFPIVDTEGWFGFDLYCAWQDVFLMSLFFFLSGLFVWPSLCRRGTANFLHGRILRLGLPFVLVVAILMPPTLYPTYLQTADDPSVAAYWRHWLA